jgi:hypothetical protein
MHCSRTNCARHPTKSGEHDSNSFLQGLVRAFQSWRRTDHHRVTRSIAGVGRKAATCSCPHSADSVEKLGFSSGSKNVRPDEATDRLRREGTRSRSEVCELSFMLPHTPSAHAVLVANESRRKFRLFRFWSFSTESARSGHPSSLGNTFPPYVGMRVRASSFGRSNRMQEKQE